MINDINNTIQTFTIYITTTGKYIKKDFCKENNIELNTETKIIQNEECYKITDKEIDEIEKKYNIKANYISNFDLQLSLFFNVYIDKNNNNKLYIQKSLCNKYNISYNTKRIINKETYCNVEEFDIEKIEKLSKNEKIALKRKYIEINLKNETEAGNNLFMYYNDIENEKIYIDRNTLELARNYIDNIETTPKIIENKNCYLIDEKDLEKIEEITKIHGIEKIIVNKDNKYILVYKDVINNKLYTKNKLFNNQIVTKEILNKQLYEITNNQLSKIHDKELIIAQLFTPPIRNIQVIICTNKNNESFVSEQILNELNITINDKKILINEEIYIKVPLNIIQLLNSKITKYTHIKIIFKSISPIKRT